VLALVKDATLGNTILAVAELCRQQCSKPETWWEALNHMDAVGHAARNERGLEARAMDATHKVGDCGWLMAKLKARTSEPVSGADVGYHPRRVDTFESRLDLVLKSLPLTWAASRCYISTEPDNEVMVDAYGHLTNLLIALLAAPPVVSTPAGSSGAADIKPDAADIKPDAADINPDAVTLREPAGPVWYGC